MFRQPGYLENFVQSIFDVLEGFAGQTLVVGGDGRYDNERAIQVIVRIAAANGFGRILVGRGGIRRRRRRAASSGSAARSAPSSCRRATTRAAPTAISASSTTPQRAAPRPRRSPRRSGTGARRSIATGSSTRPMSTSLRLGVTTVGAAAVEVFDPVADHAELLATLFDFGAIGRLLRGGTFRLHFDAMHAVTGPYAEEIFVRRLGAPPGSVVAATPLPDFGGVFPRRREHGAVSGRGLPGPRGGRHRLGARHVLPPGGLSA